MAEYLVLIYGDEKAFADYTPDDTAAMLTEHRAFTDKHGAAIKGANALWGSDTATSIREGTVTDGPFVETKEVVGGYYLVEAASLDEATAIAREVPAPSGGVEVRPVRTFD